MRKPDGGNNGQQLEMRPKRISFDLQSTDWHNHRPPMSRPPSGCRPDLAARGRDACGCGR